MNDFNIRRLENRLITSPKMGKVQNDLERKDFGQVLDRIQKKDKIKFSKHAVERMDNRTMCLSDEELQRLETAFTKAEDKGVKDALIVMGDKAFIASIKNKTVITTLNKDQLKDNVFTNIDGAVII